MVIRVRRKKEGADVTAAPPQPKAQIPAERTGSMVTASPEEWIRAAQRQKRKGHSATDALNALLKAAGNDAASQVSAIREAIREVYEAELAAERLAKRRPQAPEFAPPPSRAGEFFGATEEMAPTRRLGHGAKMFHFTDISKAIRSHVVGAVAKRSKKFLGLLTIPIVGIIVSFTVLSFIPGLFIGFILLALYNFLPGEGELPGGLKMDMILKNLATIDSELAVEKDPSKISELESERQKLEEMRVKTAKEMGLEE